MFQKSILAPNDFEFEIVKTAERTDGSRVVHVGPGRRPKANEGGREKNVLLKVCARIHFHAKERGLTYQDRVPCSGIHPS